MFLAVDYWALVVLSVLAVCVCVVVGGGGVGVVPHPSEWGC